ncbi:MAG: NAD(P)/FAD-dependent oxidoreductase [Candidatus Omnitrophica bacterium]|nr:NAD(P)/FAD-dependent oxidoreductase [Candidatus Omnitrophota bacterium]
MKSNEYDVIIIGAGIGGLTCGCYLAQAGMKVLIVEQHDKVGGYCTSFMRKRFIFNPLTSSLGNLGKDKELGKIFYELHLDNVKFIRANPSEIIRTPDFELPIYNNFDQTIADIQIMFPNYAKSIKEYFNFIRNEDIRTLYVRLRNKTFSELLEQYFVDHKLRALMGMMLWRLGMEFTKINAFTAAIHYREFIFDLGYHPIGGMQILSNSILMRFKEAGGQLLLSQFVSKITIKDAKVCGIILKNGDFIGSKFLVCACDPTHIYLDLIGDDLLEKVFVKKLKNSIPSNSSFTLFLGINRKLKDNISPTYLLCYYSNYNADKYDAKDIRHLEKQNLDIPLFFVFPSFYDQSLVPEGMESVGITILAPFKDERYWKNKKNELSDKVIKKAEEIIPNISKNIVVKETVSPFTLYRYTMNREGGVHGWACIPEQVNSLLTPQRSFIKNLFFAGQWVSLFTGESGLPTAAFTGRKVSQLILGLTKKVHIVPLEEVNLN